MLYFGVLHICNICEYEYMLIVGVHICHIREYEYMLNFGVLHICHICEYEYMWCVGVHICHNLGILIYVVLLCYMC